MRRTRVSKTCEFPRRNAVFLQKMPFRLVAEGPPGGRRQRRDVSRRGSKTPKTGEKCLVLRVRPVNSHIKLHFLLIRRSGRTPRTLFPPLESAIFRSDVAKTSLWKIHKNTHLEASSSQTQNGLKVFFAATSCFFCGDLAIQGLQKPLTRSNNLVL